MKRTIKLSFLMIFATLFLGACSDEPDGDGFDVNGYFNAEYSVGGSNELVATVDGAAVTGNATAHVAPPEVTLTNVIPGQSSVVFSGVQLEIPEEEGDVTFNSTKTVDGVEVTISGSITSDPNVLTLKVTTK